MDIIRSRHISLPRLLALVLAAFTVLGLSAQGDAMFTQYWAVPTYYNPAATGDTDNIRLRGGMRMQWVGIDNAPRTFVAAGDMPFRLFNNKQRFGTGIVMQQESMGLYRNLALNAQLSYKRPLLKGQFSVAVQIGYLNEQFKGSEVYIPDDDDYHQSADEAIPDRDVAGNALDLGVGLWYTHKYFWAGVSLLHANNPTVTFTAEGQDTTTGGTGEGDATLKKYQFTAPRTAYFTAGSNIPVKNTLFEVIPSVLVRSDFTFTDFEVTLRGRYNKMFTAGVGYRYQDAFSVMLGAEIKGIFICYSYDYHTSDISKASSGSHEIMAGYNLKLDLSDKNKNKHKSIRIM